MPLARSLYFLSVAFACASLWAQEPAPKPAEKAPEATETKTECTKQDKHCHIYHRHYHSKFGAYVQAIAPLRELKTSLDGRTGYGLGVQWTHDHGDWNASRTRLEWNTFPESVPVGLQGTKTYAKNYTLSFDHLFKLNQGTSRVYLVAGLGGVRWDLEQTTAGVRNSEWTTKLALTGGLGVQIAERVNLEARYVASSVGRTFDANTLQASLGWRF